MSLSSQSRALVSHNLTRTTRRQNTKKRKITEKVALVNMIKHTQEKSRLRERTDRAWFGRLLRYPASKRIGSSVSSRSPHSARLPVRGTLSTDSISIQLAVAQWSCFIILIIIGNMPLYNRQLRPTAQMAWYTRVQGRQDP